MVAQLTGDNGSHRSDSPSLSDAAVLTVQAITQQMFGGLVEVEVEREPSDPEFEYVVFTVRRSGDPKQLVQEHERWDDGVAEAVRDYPHAVLLMIYPG